MGGSASSSPAVQKSLANFMDAAMGGLNSQPALDQYSKQFRNMPDAAIRGVGDAVASIPDMAIAAGKLAMEGGFNPRMGQSERVKRFADTTYMPINPMMQDALTRAGVAETEGGNNLTRFVSGAMAPYALGKYAGAVGDAVGAAERGALSNSERGMIKVYHGSPHDFDEFRLDKIGTGEGAQSYGHGLYFAENEKVARSYRDALTEKPADLINAYIEGRVKYPKNEYEPPKYYLASQNLPNDPDTVSLLKRALDGAELSKDKTITYKDDAIRAFRELDEKLTKKGHIYEVNINAKPNEFLDWDKPLSEQPEYVRKAYAKAVAGDDEILSELMDGSPESLKMAGLFDRSTGAQAYNTFVANNKELGTANLKKAGIPGIKYFDQMSRYTTEQNNAKLVGITENNGDWKARLRHDGPLTKSSISPEQVFTDSPRFKTKAEAEFWAKEKLAATPTSNYVVFDPKTIEILRKYGLLGGMVGAGALADNDAKASSLSAFVGEKDDTPFDRLKRKFKGAK